jgi:hypothetical protein
MLADPDDARATEGIPSRQQPIAIEELLQWAVAQSGRLPWRRDTEDELSMNRGLTARPKKSERVPWTGAGVMIFTVGNRRQGPFARRTPSSDAAVVLEAIKSLEATVAASVLACARGKIRPDWMEGVEPYVVMRPLYGHKRNRKRRGRPVMVPEWKPCSPAEVKAAREVYARWHQALRRLNDRLQGNLDGWWLTDNFPPLEPWRDPTKSS